MKKLFLLLTLSLVFVGNAFACDFEFSTNSNQKSVKQGEEIVINVVLKLTHRSCKVAAKDTKFKFDGMKIISATDWKQSDSMIYTRQIKAKVLNHGGKNILLIATRLCNKDGGRGVFTLPVR